MSQVKFKDHEPDDWSDEQSRLFTRVFRAMGTQEAVAHPEAQRMPDDHWHTIIFNAAYTAAEELVSTADLIVTLNDKDEVIAVVRVAGGLQ